MIMALDEETVYLWLDTTIHDLVSSLWSDVVLSWCYLENHSANQASLRERERERERGSR